MNKIVFSAMAMGLLTLFSCSRMAPEIVEYDPSYKPKEPSKLNRDEVAVPPIDLLTKYVYFTDNDRVILASAIKEEDGSYTAEPINDAEVTIQLSQKLDKDLKVKITEMSEQNQPATYKTVVAGENKLLPSDMYTLSATEVTFVAGEVEHSIRVSFDKDKIKDLDKRYHYVLPLVVDIPDEPNLKDHNFCLLTIILNEAEKIIAGDNARFETGGIAGTLLPYTDLKVTTTYRPDVVGVVIDGQKSKNWWVPSGSQETLTLSFAKQRITGIKIFTINNKDLKSVDVSVSNTGGAKFIPQGKVENPFIGIRNLSSPAMITFDKPYEIDAIRFSNFVSNRDYVDITEIELYK